MSSVRKFVYLLEALINQWKNESNLKKLQLKRLKKIVKFAYNNIPFYKEKFDREGVTPKDLRRLEDIKKFPVTTKEELKSNFKKLLNSKINLSKCIIASTSGSTGNPLKIVYDEKADDFSKAINMRSYISNGLSPFSKWANIGDVRTETKQTWFQRLGVFNLLNINLFDELERQIASLDSNKIEFLTGYPSQLQLIAEKLISSGKKLKIKKVFSTAETLSQKQREIIEKGFHAPVIDLFGCIEVNRTAWQCAKQEGYHIDIDSVILEIINSKGNDCPPEEFGRVIYTSLYNYAFPIIRYDIGDIAILSRNKCSCGRGLPLLKTILGRKDDFLINYLGEKISPLKVHLIFKHSLGINSYQLIQKSNKSLKMYLVSNEKFSKDTIKDIKHKLHKLIGTKCKISCKKVKTLPKEGKNKFRSVINAIK